MFTSPYYPTAFDQKGVCFLSLTEKQVESFRHYLMSNKYNNNHNPDVFSNGQECWMHLCQLTAALCTINVRGYLHHYAIWTWC